MLILRFFLVDDTEATFASDQLIIRTDLFDTRTNFHERTNLLQEKPVLMSLEVISGFETTLLITYAEDDSALCEIVRGQLDFYGIAWY